MVQEIVGNFDGSRVRVGVVVSRFNSVVTERLEEGALDALRRHGVDEERIVVVRVPGAFEIPTVARALLAEGKVDGVVGLGCVIRGKTSHYDYVCEAAERGTRIPSGHPEAFIEAFANIYVNATDTVRAKTMGVEPTELELDYPTVYDGARGVRFIEKVVESSQSDQKWLPFE